jgi:pimeloyl-ACP methyl ester carboxylesterase
LRKLVVLLCLSASVAAYTHPAAAQGHTVQHLEVRSKSADPVDVAISVFKPAGASATTPVPVILESHGWGGSRRTSVNDGVVKPFLDAGIGVVSIDQRGHGGTGGLRHLQDPAREAQDVISVIDTIATFDWVRLDAPGDPVLGAIGGSYGGGFQTMTALTEISETGRTRFDALAPEITWYDFPTALAPEGVARTAWLSVVYAAGKAPCSTKAAFSATPQSNLPDDPADCESKIAPWADDAFAWTLATGQWPGREDAVQSAAEEAAGIADLTSILRSHSPSGFVEDGMKLDIPILQRQGATDNLLNLNQGLDIFHNALTEEARARSIFTSYNGGHPFTVQGSPPIGSLLPPASVPSGDPCNPGSGGWQATRIAFFQQVFAGNNPREVLSATKGYKAYNLATTYGPCIRMDALPAPHHFDVDPAALGAWAAPSGPAAPHHVMLAEGPLTVAGEPRLSGKLLNLGVDSRAFLALSIASVESMCADARVMQNNVMPLRELTPQAGATPTPFDVALPAVAASLKAGEALCLTVSPQSDQSFGHGGKTPGLMALQDLELRVPLSR